MIPTEAHDMLLTQDQLMIRDAVRAFAQEQLWPHAARWDKEHHFPKEAHRGLAELGCYGICVPESLGGAGLDIAFRDKWSHVNRNEYRAFIAHWNPNDYQKSSQHKYLEKSVLQLAQVPTAPLIAYLHRLHGRDAYGAPVREAADLERLLHALRASK